jgi:hypothetical protein
VLAEYAKAAPDDILIRITVANRGPEAARLHLLLTLWFRNTWGWGSAYEEGRWPKPHLDQAGEGTIVAEHTTLGRFRLVLSPGPDGKLPPLLFTENETNFARLYGMADGNAYVKDAFHEYVIHGKRGAVNPGRRGTKAAAHYLLEVSPRSQHTVCLRLSAEGEAPGQPFGAEFDRGFAERIREADAFYTARIPQNLSADERLIARQAYAGLLWSEQCYHWVVSEWLQRPLPAEPARKPVGPPQRRVVPPPLLPGRAQRAGQVGVPGLLRLGPGLPHAPAGSRRSGASQVPASPVLA